MGFQQLTDAMALGKRENVQFRADDAARYSQNFPQGCDGNPHATRCLEISEFANDLEVN